MNFQDLIIESFYNEEDLLEEGFFPITPFLAYASFKDSTFGKLKNKMIDLKTKVGDLALGVKSDALVAKEKIRADIGMTTGKGEGATVYKLTKEQNRVMAEIYKKHGKKIIKDIIDFRIEVLAPYSLIKRKIKEASRATNKDRFGMTHAEFKVYLESGRRKIESRGDAFKDKSEELRDKLERIRKQISLLEDAEKSLEEGEFPKSILNRIYKRFEVEDSDLLGYSAEELRQIENENKKSESELSKLDAKLESGDVDIEDIERIIKLSTRKSLSGFQKDKEGKKIARGDFDIAFARYLFRRNILDSLRGENKNYFKKVYLDIVSEMIDNLTENQRSLIRKISSLNNSIALNKKESLIWKRRKTASPYSNDLNDYYQAIEDKDFLDAPIYLERSTELKEAEQKIENEIRRFERALSKKIGKEDFDKLKQYRLINNLISVRDLKNPNELFKSKEEVIKSTGGNEKDMKKSMDFISPEDFERRVWTMYNYEFSSSKELNDAKKELEMLINMMKEQGEDEILKKMSRIIERFNLRKTLEKQDELKFKDPSEYTVDINTIQKKAEEILSKTYSNTYEQKRDKSELEGLMKTFADVEGFQGKRELDRIRFLLDKVERKLTFN